MLRMSYWIWKFRRRDRTIELIDEALWDSYFSYWNVVDVWLEEFLAYLESHPDYTELFTQLRAANTDSSLLLDQLLEIDPVFIERWLNSQIILEAKYASRKRLVARYMARHIVNVILA